MKFLRPIPGRRTIATAGRFMLLLIPMLWCLPATVMAGVDNEYLRGYVDALLDSRYPGLGLRAQTITLAKSVTLTSQTCLSPSQKRDIVYLLNDAGGINDVRWALSADCDGSGATPEPGGTPTGDEAPISIDFRALPEEELFAPLIADTRQPRFSMSYQNYRGNNREFSAAKVAMGEYFGLASGLFGKAGSSQVGIQAAVFALIEHKALALP